jgi:hypothetical protein
LSQTVCRESQPHNPALLLFYRHTRPPALSMFHTTMNAYPSATPIANPQPTKAKSYAPAFHPITQTNLRRGQDDAIDMRTEVERRLVASTQHVEDRRCFGGPLTQQ